MMPIVDGLEAEFAGQVNVVRLDAGVPENGRLLTSLGLRGHPTMAIVDASGTITATYSGPQEAEVLRAAITAVVPE